MSGLIDDSDLGTAVVAEDDGAGYLDIQLTATYSGEFSATIWLKDDPIEVQAEVDDVQIVVEPDIGLI